MAGGKFGGGAGTLANPYLIEDADDLNEMRRNITSHFKLVNNINLGVPPYNSGKGWLPIQGDFTGSLDGNGKAIMNLTINRIDEDYVALFSSLKGNVKDLGFIKPNITGRGYLAVLFAKSEGAALTLERIYILNGTITSDSTQQSDYIGGLGNTITGSNVHYYRDMYIQCNLYGLSVYTHYAGNFMGYSYNTNYNYVRNIIVVGDADIGANGTYYRYGDIGYQYRTAVEQADTCFVDGDVYTGAASLFTKKTTAELKDITTLTGFSTRTISGASNTSVNGTSTWLIKQGFYPRLYNQMFNKIFILTNSTDYRVWNGTSWVLKYSVEPTREQFLADGMLATDSIPYSAWELLKSYTSVEIVNLIDKTSGATVTTTTLNIDTLDSNSTQNRNTYRKTLAFSNYGSAINKITGK